MWRNSGQSAAVPAMAASTCSQRPCSRQMRPISGDRIDGIRRSRAHRGADEARAPARCRSCGDLPRQRIGPHGETFVDLDQAQVVAPQAGDPHAFLDRRMGLRRGVGDQRAIAAALIAGAVRGPFAGGQDRAQRRAGRRVLDHAAAGAVDWNFCGRPSRSTSQSSTWVSSSVQAGLVAQSIPCTPSPAESSSPRIDGPELFDGK